VIELKNPPSKGGRRILRLKIDDLSLMKAWLAALKAHSATDDEWKLKTL
jgi:hypothetical protein